MKSIAYFNGQRRPFRFGQYNANLLSGIQSASAQTELTDICPEYTSAWESIADLRSELAAWTTGTLNLSGRRFCCTSEDSTAYVEIPDGISITGFEVSGSGFATWTSEGSDVYSCPSELLDVEVRQYVSRADGSVLSPAVYPAVDSGTPAVAAFGFDGNWLDLTDDVSYELNGSTVTSGAFDTVLIQAGANQTAILAHLQSWNSSSFGAVMRSGGNVITACRIVWVYRGDVLRIAIEDASGTPTISSVYFQMRFIGCNPSDLADGEFCIDYSQTTPVIYVKSTAGTSDLMIPRMRTLLGMRSGRTASFDSARIRDAFGSYGSGLDHAGLIIGTTQATQATVTLTNCILSNAAASIYRVSLDADSVASVGPFIQYNALVYDGAQIIDSFFSSSARAESVRVFCDWGSDYTAAVRQTVIRSSVFEAQYAAHGNCLSLYQDSWQNATVEGNIFLNSNTMIAFQRMPSSWPPRTTPGTLRIAGNLFYLDQVAPLPGQWAIAWNGGNDDHLDTNQIVEIVGNTLWTDAAYRDSYQFWAIDVRYLDDITVRVGYNITSAIGTPDAGSRTNHYRASNAILRDPLVSISPLGSTDCQTGYISKDWPELLTPYECESLADSVGAVYTSKPDRTFSQEIASPLGLLFRFTLSASPEDLPWVALES